MLKISLLIISISLSISCLSQTYWRVENDRGEELLLTITINAENNTFETYTRRDALKEMAGSFMYMMAKTAGKIKYPELMHGEGKTTYNGDTTYYNGNIDYPDKIFTLKAKTWKNNFYALLSDSKNKTTILTGEKVASGKPIRDYPSLINNSFLLTEKYYWDQNILKSSDWANFKKEINELKPKIADDYELAMTMMWLGKKLNPIPHEIKKLNKKPIEQQRKGNSLKIVNGNKAILFLGNIPDNKDDTEQIFKELNEKKIETLIVEASGNRNLSLSSALMLANHLNSKPSDWGCYLTRKWAESGNSVPQPASYESALKNPLTYSGISNEIFSEKGFYLKTIPSESTFKGKVYFLINKGSSNVAEALAIYLKNEKLVTLVGQKTAGFPVLSNVFELDKLYRLNIPFAQFYDKNGKSYQGIGIEPDHFIEQDAIGYVLKL